MLMRNLNENFKCLLEVILYLNWVAVFEIYLHLIVRLPTASYHLRFLI